MSQRPMLQDVVVGGELYRIETPLMDKTNGSAPSSNLGDLPEEILASVLRNLLDVSQMTILDSVGPTSENNPLQLLCSMQMSLCRVSKRFYRCAAYLMRRNNLLRVTCWLDPHLDFYYLSPTICRSDRTDMFQIPTPHLTIHLTRDYTNAVCVQSIASVHHLPLMHEIVQLHHAAGLILLPCAYDVHDATREISFTVSCEFDDAQDHLQTVKSSLQRHFPGLNEGETVDGISRYVWGRQESKIIVPTSSWRIAFQLGRMLCVSSHHSPRRLGLKILRYLLVSMLVVIDPLNPIDTQLRGSYMNLRMMALISAALIDALVVESELFTLFYDDDSTDVAYTLHHEICPCRYMPYGIDSGEVYGFAEAEDSWWFIRITIHFLHSILVRESSIQQARIKGLRQLQADLPLGASKLQSRCHVYIKVLRQYYLSSNCHRCISSSPENAIHFPSLPETNAETKTVVEVE